MGEPLRRWAAADIDDPLPKYRGVDERFSPKSLRYRGALTAQRAQCVVRNERDLASAKRRDVMIHDLQMETLQIRNVAGDVNRENLAPALIRCFRAAGKPFDQQARLAGPVALSNDRLLGRDVPGHHRQALDGRDVVVIEVRGRAQLAN